jgi:hypothetical protein
MINGLHAKKYEIKMKLSNRKYFRFRIENEDD